MHHLFVIAVLFSLTLAGAATAARAAGEKYVLNKPHTQVVFYADHLGFSKSVGKFTDYEGGFTFDAVHPEQSSVDVTIKTASLEMNDEKWNAHLKGPDFFDVERFPAMTFKGAGVKVLSDNTAEITGDLTLRGMTKPVTLKVTHNKTGAFPMGKRYVAGFSAAATIKRSEFGMTYGLPAMGDDVVIHLEVEGDRVDQEEPAPPTQQ